MNKAFDNEGWIKQSIANKIKKIGDELKGDEASAFLACMFSNATNNNYEALDLLDRIDINQYEITIKKIK
jgi:hypothetical protein